MPATEVWVPYLKDPLILIGFVLLLLFSFGRQIIRSDKLTKVTSASTARILERALLYLVIVSALVILFGFALRFYEIRKGQDIRATVIEEGQRTRSSLNEIADTLQKELARIADPAQAEQELQGELADRLRQERDRFVAANVAYKQGYRLFTERSFQSAAEAFQAAIDKVPDFFAARVALARSEVAVGDKGRAREEFLEAARIAAQRQRPIDQAAALAQLALALSDDPSAAIGPLEDAEVLVNDVRDPKVQLLALLARKPLTTGFRDQLLWLAYVIATMRQQPDLQTASELMEGSLHGLEEYLEFGDSIGILDGTVADLCEVFRKNITERSPATEAIDPTEVLRDVAVEMRKAVFFMLLAFPSDVEARMDDALTKLETRLRGQFRVPRSPIQNAKRQARATQPPSNPVRRSTDVRIARGIDQYTDLLEKQPSRADAYYHRGRFLLAAARVPEALADFTKAIQYQSQHQGALLHRAIAYVQTGDMRRASADFEAAIAIVPTWAAPLARARGLAAERPLPTEEILRALGQASSEKPDSVDVLLCQAETYAQSQEFAQAIAILNRALELRPDLDRARLALADVYRLTAAAKYSGGALQAAIVDLASAAVLDSSRLYIVRAGVQFSFRYSPVIRVPSFEHRRATAAATADDMLFLGYVHLLFGALLPAAAQFAQVRGTFRGTPEALDAVFSLGPVLTELNRVDEAIAAYTDVITARPSDKNYSLALVRRGILYHRIGKLGDALKDYDAYLSTGASNSEADDARYYRASILESRGDTDAALDAYSQIVQRTSGNWINEARDRRGALLEKKGDLKGALADYDSALLSIHGLPIPSYLRSAEILFRLKQLDRALVRYRRVIQLARGEQPQTEESRRIVAAGHVDIGSILALRGDLMGARESYSSAIDVQPRGPLAAAAYLRRGEVFRRLGEAQLALTDYSRAIELRPSAAGLVARASLESDRGDNAGAIRDFKGALKLDAKDAAALNGLAWQLATHDRDLAEALALSKRSLEIDPLNGNFWDTAAEIYLRLSQFDRAAEANGKARKYTSDKEALSEISAREQKIGAHRRR